MLLKFRNNKKTGGLPAQAGMTYVELIVVLSIFAIVTGTIIFNYKQFQQKVDLSNLANDIALKFVDAQKSSTSGEIPFGKVPNPPAPAAWKPSYGVGFHFVPNTINKIFYYFSDLDQNKEFDGITNNCPSTGGSSECLDIINITKGSGIYRVRIYYVNGNSEYTDVSTETNVSVTFTRPDSGASIKIDGYNNAYAIDYIILFISPEDGSLKSSIKIHSSGKIEINK